MKLLSIFIGIAFTFLSGQDRSLIFTTGSPEGTEGHSIQWDGSSGNAIADRFHVSANMVLEALKIYATAPSGAGNARVVLHSDSGGVPGEEIHSWDIDIASATHGANYFLIITTDLCIFLDEANYYWLAVYAADAASDITWIYSNNANFTYTSSDDQGDSWNTATVGQCGALSVYTEYIYEPEESSGSEGDINGDGATNVLDVVVLANAVLNGTPLLNGDINGDGQLNVLDIVSLVNIILNGAPPVQLPTWEYVDLNMNSPYFGEMIGPDTFNNEIAIYYFGKAG